MDTHIYLIRHAQAFWNISGKIWYLWAEDALTDTGKVQAEMLWKSLRKLLEETPHHIHLSQAHRTFETATHSGIINVGSQFSISPALNEIEMGKLIWQSTTETNRSIFQSVLWWSDIRFPGWESINDVKQRMIQFLSGLDSRVLHICVTHWAAISSVLSYIDPWVRSRPKNASITPISINNGKIKLISNP